MKKIINYFSVKEFRIKKRKHYRWKFWSEYISKFQADVFLFFHSKRNYKIISVDEIKLQQENVVLQKKAKAEAERLRIINEKKTAEAAGLCEMIYKLESLPLIIHSQFFGGRNVSEMTVTEKELQEYKKALTDGFWLDNSSPGIEFHENIHYMQDIIELRKVKKKEVADYLSMVNEIGVF